MNHDLQNHDLQNHDLQNDDLQRLEQELAMLLKERMQKRDGYERAMRRALARKPFLHSADRYLTRDQTHDRSRLR